MQNYKTYKRIILTCMVILLFYSGTCQEFKNNNTSSNALNATYVSYGGPGIFFSTIYERQLIAREGYNLGIKGGIGTSISSAIFPHEFNFPLGVFLLYGKRKHHLDVSANLTSYLLEQYNYNSDKSIKKLRLLYIPSVCYRYQKRNGGFMGRIGFSPVFNFNAVSNTSTPWIGVSLGWAF